METNYISTVEKTDANYHRSHVILHSGQWHFGDFETMDQLNLLAKTLGFSYELVEEKPWQGKNDNIYRRYTMSHNLETPYMGGFWKVGDLPSDVKPIKALSNGSIVTCYFTNDGKTIKMYRPNPNAKDVYKPLSTELHIAHVRIYGLY